MAEQRGGYRRPAKPAPVSGPGALSRRTDGGPSQGARYMRGGPYGEGQELMGLQQAAPMAAASQAPTPMAATPRELPPIVGLTAPTQRPDEPPEVGMPFGPGPGPEILGFEKPDRKLSEVFMQIAANDKSGESNAIAQFLMDRNL